jgi:hypothetical protein
LVIKAKKVKGSVLRGTETTVKAVVISQEKCTGVIFKIYTKNEGMCWTLFYKYVKVMVEDIAKINDGHGRLITDLIEKANAQNCCYSSLFSSENSISQMKCANSCKPFTISTEIMRRRLEAISKNKSVWLDSVSGKILKQSGEAIIPYLVQLLDITVYNPAVPSDWKNAIVVHIFRRGNHLLVLNYTPISLALGSTTKWNTL